MGCTIDNLRTDHRVEIIQDFVDARGVKYHSGQSGIVRRMELDWPRQEIQIEWECNDARAILIFSLNAKEGPRNGKMREYFLLGEFVDAPRSVSQSRERSGPELAGNANTSISSSSRPAVSFAQFAGKHPPGEICLGEFRVACDCDPAFCRDVLIESRNITVTACLCCGALTCTRSVGDDGRFHGNAWHAYWTVGITQSVADWLAQWPRVRATHQSPRWPMSHELLRQDFLYYPSTTRCRDLDELAALERQLILGQSAKSNGQRLRELQWPQGPPPPKLPDTLRGFKDVWETLQLQPNSDLEKLVRMAQPLSHASSLAVELLWERPDGFEVMVHALRSGDETRQATGFAMALNSRVPCPGLANVIIEILLGLPLDPLPDVPGRIISCARYEALLVLIAELQLGTPNMLKTLDALQRRLARHDAYLVKYIHMVVRELTVGSPLSHRKIDGEFKS